jgi:hypothetical protein
MSQIPEFQETSWGWQVQQAIQQGREWWDYQFQRTDPTVPRPSFEPPAWLPQLLFSLLLTGLVLWLIWQVYQEFSPQIQRWLAQEQGLQRLSPTPTPAKTSADGWVRRSRQAHLAGDHREACRCLYWAMLMQLSDRNLLPPSDSRTDGEYRTLLAVDNPAPYDLLLTMHERLCFSTQPIAATDWEQCWAAYQELQP